MLYSQGLSSCAVGTWEASCHGPPFDDPCASLAGTEAPASAAVAVVSASLGLEAQGLSLQLQGYCAQLTLLGVRASWRVLLCALTGSPGTLYTRTGGTCFSAGLGLRLP